MLLYIIFAALLVTAGLLIQFQLAMKRYQRDMGKTGGMRPEDVVSLDEEEIEAKQFKAPPSKVYLFGSVAVTCMLVVWFVVFGSEAPAEGTGTYDELGIRAMCEQMMNVNSSERGTKTLLILPQNIFLEYMTLKENEPNKAHPLVDEIVKDTLGKGKRYEIVAIEPSVSVARKIVEIRDNDLTPTGLRDIMRKHEGVQAVIALVGFHKVCGEEVPSSRDRSFYLAVFCSEARLYEYLELARARAFDLAVMANGLYNRNTVIPEKPGKDELVKLHFTFLTPQNEAFIRGSFRQVTMKNADIR